LKVLRTLKFKRNCAMKITLAAILGLSLAAAAQAQTGTINQLFAFTCSGGSNNEKCPQGARPDLIIQASDGNLFAFTCSGGISWVEQSPEGAKSSPMTAFGLWMQACPRPRLPSHCLTRPVVVWARPC
jgi:hypothetical protein